LPNNKELAESVVDPVPPNDTGTVLSPTAMVDPAPLSVSVTGVVTTSCRELAKADPCAVAVMNAPVEPVPVAPIFLIADVLVRFVVPACTIGTISVPSRPAVTTGNELMGILDIRVSRDSERGHWDRESEYPVFHVSTGHRPQS